MPNINHHSRLLQGVACDRRGMLSSPTWAIRKAFKLSRLACAAPGFSPTRYWLYVKRDGFLQGQNSMMQGPSAEPD